MGGIGQITGAPRSLRPCLSSDPRLQILPRDHVGDRQDLARLLAQNQTLMAAEADAIVLRRVFERFGVATDGRLLRGETPGGLDRVGRKHWCKGRSTLL